MSQDLPDDVWSQIAETMDGYQEALDMSLTSRRMRRLVVPVLFRDLRFDFPPFAASGPFMARLIRDTIRARFLFNSPGLLQHTRLFTFREHLMVDTIADCLALHEGSDSSSWRGDAENFVIVRQDTIYRLISRMPGLRKLYLCTTVMTPLSYAAISSRHLLTSLTLVPSRPPDITHVTPAFPYALRLRDFEYYAWTINDSPDPYVTDILKHCILDLERLAINCSLLPFVVSLVPLHRTLSLLSLSVGFTDESSGSLAVEEFLQVLRACPQLLHLQIEALHPNVELPHHPPPPMLSKLSTFSGTSYFLQILSGGTNLVKIGIDDIIYLKEQWLTQTPHELLTCDTFYLKEQSLTQVIRSSPTHLRELSMGHVIVSQAPDKLLTFIKSLALFQNLERLDITYELDMSWKDHVSAQDSHNTIKDLLNQLACLRFIDIHSLSVATESYDIGCPISEPGEPGDRGHPSLEGIYIDFICGTWSWDSRTGWERGDWAIPSLGGIIS